MPDVAQSGSRQAVPGLVPAGATALLSAVICWLWLAAGLGSAVSPPSGSVAASDLAAVADPDLTAALTTLNSSDTDLTQFQRRPGACPQPLAWVTLARSPEQSPGTIRIQSGQYFSPLFTLTDVPMRVAIPFPARYEAGQGQIVVFDSGGGATIALTPAWTLPAHKGGAVHNVTWRPLKRCPSSNG